MDKFYIRKDSLQPHYVAVAVDADGVPINLAGAIVYFKMRNAKTDTLVTSASAVVDSPAGGLMRYPWVASDTAVEVVFKAKFEVYSLAAGTFFIPRVPEEEAFVVIW